MGDHLVWMGENLSELIVRTIPALKTPTTMELAVQFLDRWQTLVSGLLALVAAGWTVYFLRRQINIELKRDEDASKRAERGARIRVSHALSPLSVYADQGIIHWAMNDLTLDFPSLPSSSIDTLMQVAKDVDGETFESIRQLVLEAQVLNARATGFLSSAKPPLNWREVLIHDLLYFKCLVNKLYKYGRDQSLTLPFEEPTRAELEKAVPSLVTLGIQGEEEDTLKNEIETALNRQCY